MLLLLPSLPPPFPYCCHVLCQLPACPDLFLTPSFMLLLAPTSQPTCLCLSTLPQEPAQEQHDRATAGPTALQPATACILGGVRLYAEHQVIGRVVHMGSCCQASDALRFRSLHRLQPAHCCHTHLFCSSPKTSSQGRCHRSGACARCVVNQTRMGIAPCADPFPACTGPPPLYSSAGHGWPCHLVLYLCAPPLGTPAEWLDGGLPC